MIMMMIIMIIIIIKIPLQVNNSLQSEQLLLVSFDGSSLFIDVCYLEPDSMKNGV